MYNYISIIICSIFILYSIRYVKSVVNPLLVFSTLWGVILLLNSLNLFYLNTTEENIYFIIFIGIISFGIGYIIVNIFKKRYSLSILKSNNKITLNKTYVPRYNLLCFMGIICILYYLKDFNTVLKLLINGNGLDAIRNMAQNPESIMNVRSSIENALRILIIIPTSMALEPIAAIDLWIGRKHKPLIIICITIIILRVLSEGGRTPIVNFIFYIVVAYFISKHSSEKKIVRALKRKKWYLIFVFILGCVILWYSTLSRDRINTFKNIYYYFAMEPYMFNVWGNIAKDNNLIGYGLASFNGFIFPILYLIKNFFGIPFPEYWSNIYNLILQTDSQWQIITINGIRANAYVSTFWFFYLDGRMWGVVLGMLVYGMISAKTFITAQRNPTCKNICIYAIILQGILYSFIRFSFSNIYYTLSILFVVIVAYKSLNKEF
ncbi:O-antigen polymerase [Clostridium perfringens]|nr:O-antigen polymerase [Clostridium perfringens]